MFARLSEYLDGELPADLCAGFEGHLGDCPPCGAFLESLRRTVRIVQEADAPALPDDLRREVLEAYRRMRSEAGGG
jgi:anti-sigma factor RsiW